MVILIFKLKVSPLHSSARCSAGCKRVVEGNRGDHADAVMLPFLASGAPQKQRLARWPN